MSEPCKHGDILKKLSASCPFPTVFENVEADMGSSFIKIPKQKIGHVRADHDGYRWWNSAWPCHKDLITPDIASEINDVYDALTSDTGLSDLNALRAFCRKHPEAQVSPTSTDEYNFYLVGETCNFWLRLITRRGDYNMYLHAFTKDEPFGRYYEYLEQLRLSGKINMFDAVPYLQETFPELQEDRPLAKKVLTSWMSSCQEAASC